MFRLKIFVAALAMLWTSRAGFAAPEDRQTLIKAALTEDGAEQISLLQKLIGSSDSLVEQALTAWRGGGLYLLETNDTKVPFLLEAQSDSSGAARGIRVSDGAVVADVSAKPIMFVASDLTAVDTNSKLRKAIKTVLDLFALGNANPKIRRDAVIKLGQEQNAEYLPYFEARLGAEKNTEVRRALAEAVALTKLASEDSAVRVTAV
ncbi:MAG TPA: hypothetical protein VM680_04335, partial [Verrucomicrobiae bacterium]|nr:hypothetical protein [Verrucomicrobiae bacterium]